MIEQPNIPVLSVRSSKISTRSERTFQNISDIGTDVSSRTSNEDSRNMKIRSSIASTKNSLNIADISDRKLDQYQHGSTFPTQWSMEQVVTWLKSVELDTVAENFLGT